MQREVPNPFQTGIVHKKFEKGLNVWREGPLWSMSSLPSTRENYTLKKPCMMMNNNAPYTKGFQEFIISTDSVSVYVWKT